MVATTPLESIVKQTSAVSATEGVRGAGFVPSGAGTMPITLGAGGLSANTDNSTGGGSAHPNAQPTLVLNSIIKT